ncbi:shikimate dehydrogenase [Thalassotalea sp. G2M2-11]|uniref:shikimate dehydrogenase n=1 Tax=Thalassotalea sp. G2M2-11 TaxID=2787627 RepID=UPI0019D01591|nr:shikimate dehydrogenase [Thalassotalea sp. G2M2-11]
MDQYRVYGNPIKQSRSPFIHQRFAEQTNQQLNYQSELVALDKFVDTVQAFAESGGKGANVTAPFKEQAMALCDQLSERAQLAGSVNTLSFVKGKILGDTTDGDGLVNDLIANNVKLAQQNVLLLGAGGAAKGVVPSLLEQDPKQLVIANRTLANAQTIVAQYPDKPLSACSFEQLSDAKFDVIINATSAGLNGKSLAIPEQLLDKHVSCYDMSYGPSLTPFLQLAHDRQVKKAIDGLGMLVGQAAVSFEIWRQVKPQPEQVLCQLRKEMQ